MGSFGGSYGGGDMGKRLYDKGLSRPTQLVADSSINALSPRISQG